MNARRFVFFRRSKDTRPYQVCKIDAGNGKASVEVTESPNGRTAYVSVNGVQVFPVPAVPQEGSTP